MKYIKMLSLAAAVSFMFSSCDDMIMEWYKDPNKGEVAMSDLPLPLAEKIERYEVLKNYSDFKLGVGVGLIFLYEQRNLPQYCKCQFRRSGNWLRNEAWSYGGFQWPD